MKNLLTLLANPLVRQIARPLIAEIVEFVRGRRDCPSWLDMAIDDVPELRMPIAAAEARRRARRS